MLKKHACLPTYWPIIWSNGRRSGRNKSSWLLCVGSPTDGSMSVPRRKTQLKAPFMKSSSSLAPNANGRRKKTTSHYCSLTSFLSQVAFYFPLCSGLYVSASSHASKSNSILTVFFMLNMNMNMMSHCLVSSVIFEILN